MIETKILDKLSDSEKTTIENDYQCFGWEIANAQKTDYRTVHEEGGFVTGVVTVHNDHTYYWTLTVKRDTNMKNFEQINKYFNEYVSAKQEYDMLDKYQSSGSKVKALIYILLGLFTFYILIGFYFLFKGIKELIGSFSGLKMSKSERKAKKDAAWNKMYNSMNSAKALLY